MRQLRWKWPAYNIHATGNHIDNVSSIGIFTTTGNWLHLLPNAMLIVTNFLHHIFTFKYCFVCWAQKTKDLYLLKNIRNHLKWIVSDSLEYREKCVCGSTQLKERRKRISSRTVFQYPNLVAMGLNRHLYHLLKCQNDRFVRCTTSDKWDVIVKIQWQGGLLYTFTSEYILNSSNSHLKLFSIAFEYASEFHSIGKKIATHTHQKIYINELIFFFIFLFQNVTTIQRHNAFNEWCLFMLDWTWTRTLMKSCS